MHELEAPLSFSLPLHCGLFNGTGPIPLSRNWGVGGLNSRGSFKHQIVMCYLIALGGASTDNLLMLFMNTSNLSLVAEVQTPAPK